MARSEQGWLAGWPGRSPGEKANEGDGHGNEIKLHAPADPSIFRAEFNLLQFSICRRRPL